MQVLGQSRRIEAIARKAETLLARVGVCASKECLSRRTFPAANNSAWPSLVRWPWTRR